MNTRAARQKSKNDSKRTQTNKIQHQIKSKTQAKRTNHTEICAVCLNQFDKEFVTLNCKHKFCSADCARGWWKFNQSCPYCRKDITCIDLGNGETIERQTLSQVDDENDKDFIPRCQQCWGDIQEKSEKWQICITCRNSFIHTNCMMYKQNYWHCYECNSSVDKDGEKIYPLIPYNPVFHYLINQLDHFKKV